MIGAVIILVLGGILLRLVAARSRKHYGQPLNAHTAFEDLSLVKPDFERDLIINGKARVNVLLGRQVVAMPALIVLGMWIAIQLVSGVGTIAYTDENANEGGVAYMAHIGGVAAARPAPRPDRKIPASTLSHPGVSQANLTA